MPIPLPKLDVHTFDDLVNDGRALLPRYTPGWTDHNVHDPGITLMELFAWLAEMDLYRLDRVPEGSIRAFLRLLGVEPKPAQVGQVVNVRTRDFDLFQQVSVQPVVDFNRLQIVLVIIDFKPVDFSPLVPIP